MQKAGSGSRGVDSPRRRWSEAQRRRIVAESYRSGESASAVARRHGVHTSVLFKVAASVSHVGGHRRRICPGGGRGARAVERGSARAHGDRAGRGGAGHCLSLTALMEPPMSGKGELDLLAGALVEAVVEDGLDAAVAVGAYASTPIPHSGRFALSSPSSSPYCPRRWVSTPTASGRRIVPGPPARGGIVS